MLAQSGTKKLLLPLFLLAGLGAGAAGAFFANEAPEPLPNNFKVSASNTPGFPEVKGGDFALTDHFGNQRTSKNPDGNFQLVFFGYAECKAICSQALPTIAEATDVLESLGVEITPLLITVDPKRDTVSALAKAAPKIHSKMIGLTGSDEKLEAAYKAFNLTKKFLFTHPDEGDVFSHGSFIYLLDGNGKFQTLFPPVLSPVRIAEVTAGYVNKAREDVGS